MTRYKVTVPAGSNQRFAPGCFDDQVGREVPVMGAGPAILVAYELVDSGQAVTLTLDGQLPPEALPPLDQITIIEEQ